MREGIITDISCIEADFISSFFIDIVAFEKNIYIRKIVVTLESFNDICHEQCHVHM